MLKVSIIALFKSHDETVTMILERRKYMLIVANLQLNFSRVFSLLVCVQSHLATELLISW